ncbi:MAG TPA: ATP-binding protein [Aromatoleum sp.]|uniref:sensor histidine kinase n=1 Tax=Aromatoleum sp. TaxID=2307007 RepID=UPI002B4A61FF|nr:ATP-binding protein [Aromatoleum sp.]HJV28109.1 ATP-binding protein [Aromatoleum sp.]
MTPISLDAAAALRQKVRGITSPRRWIAVVVVLGQLALTLLLWNGLELLIEERQSRLLDAETAGLGQRFGESLQQRITALERMAKRWETAGGTPHAQWEQDAANYVVDLQGFLALQWVDTRGRVQWIVPERGNEAAIGLDNSRDAIRYRMLQRARASAAPIVTGPIDLVQGGRGLLITRALTVGRQADGYLVAVFRVDELLEPLSREIDSLSFGLEVTLGGESVFRRGVPPQSSLAQRQAREFVIDDDARWQVRIWPNDTAVQRGPFSDLFLASGVAITLLVAVAFWFWGRNAHAASKLKEANLALRTERNFITGLIDNANALSIVFDPVGNIVRFNRACEELTGYSAEEVLGKRLWDIAAPQADVPRTVESFSRLVARGHYGRFEGSLVAKDGRAYEIAWSNSVLTDPDGRPKYVMSVGMDVTERKRAADALVAAKEDADRANRAKSEFLSSMSHELRTPMNAVLGFAQLIAMDPQLAPTHRESVDHILKAGDLLLHLINDILNLSKIESGRIEPELETIACSDLIDDCIGMVSPLAQRNEVTIESGGDHELVVEADHQFLKQIVLNLLSNAIKYNRPGGLVRVHGTLGSNGNMRLMVSDTGQGIAPEHQAHLFEPFNRLGARNGSIEGSGIGLVVCKRLIEAMGGEIHVVSDPGHGSTFTVTLSKARNVGPSTRPPRRRRPTSTTL